MGYYNTPKEMLTRRRFLLQGGRAALGLALFGMAAPACSLFSAQDDRFVRPARHWHALGAGRVQCDLCPNQCVLGGGERGACRVRENRGGRLVTLVYSRLAAIHIDPIEKKPFNHFLPGSLALSVATAGCNLRCRFCQNWQLSQSTPESLDAEEVSPSALAARAAGANAPVIAFTYNEPTVQFEYVIDAAAQARRAGKRPVIISSGYARPEAGRELARSLDAVKIDLKAFSERFYSDICGGSLRAVLDNLVAVRSAGTWLELVVLIIPTLNDSPAEIRQMAAWVKRNLSADVPMHFTRFHPMYLIRNIPPTPVVTLERCREIATAEGIRYAYVGNVPGHRYENTCCHQCGRTVIERSGIYSTVSRLRGGRCPNCNTLIPGVWS